MSNYKNVRLEDHVYQELIQQQRPRESISQTLGRLLLQGKKFAEVIEQLNQILYPGETKD